MKSMHQQLKEISSSLTVLARQVDRFSRQVERMNRNEFTGITGTQGERKGNGRRSPGAKRATVLDTVYDAVRRSKSGASLNLLRQKTGLESRQLSNALYKLTKKGMVEAKKRGVYIQKSGPEAP